jgi:WD40 repeat protein
MGFISFHLLKFCSLTTCGNESLIVTCGDDNLVKLWDLSATDLAKPKTLWNGHLSYVNWVDCDSSGQMIVSAGLDGSIRFWHQDMREEVFIFQTKQKFYHVSFLPQQTHLVVTAGEEGIHLWDVRKHSSYLEKAKG